MDTRTLVRGQATRTTQLLSGHVSRHQPAPATFADPLYVILPSRNESDVIAFDGGDWPQDHGATLPVAGDSVLLGRDERGRLWLIRWNTTT